MIGLRHLNYLAYRDPYTTNTTRLPSTRDLASQYQLARGTIINAFEQLKAEGYVDGTVGSDMGMLYSENPAAERPQSHGQAHGSAKTRRRHRDKHYGS